MNELHQLVAAEAEHSTHADHRQFAAVDHE